MPLSRMAQESEEKVKSDKIKKASIIGKPFSFVVLFASDEADGHFNSSRV